MIKGQINALYAVILVIIVLATIIAVAVELQTHFFSDAAAQIVSLLTIKV